MILPKPSADSWKVGFLGHGAALPAAEVTNADLSRMVDTNDEWIQRRTGVRTRRVLRDGETLLDLAATAAQRALDDAGLSPREVGEVRVAVCTWMRLPSLASRVQEALGIPDVPCADVAAGCAGFVYAIEDVWSRLFFQRMRYGRRTNALVIGIDALSHITDWSDRSTCVLLGDGAGAVVLGEVAEGGLLATHTSANGRCGDLLCTEANGHEGRQVLRMDGRAVFAAAVDTMVRDVRTVLAKYGSSSGRTVEVRDLAYVYPHQANLRILERVARRLKLPPERFYTRGIVKYGNTSAASIPLAYADQNGEASHLPRPRFEVDVAFGAGFASGAILREVV